MDADEYDNLERTERDHWYYAGKREVVRYWVSRLAPLRAEQTLLDCGAGTGCFAAEMATQCQVLVLDDHEESLRRLRERFPAEKVLRVSAEGIPLPDGSVDVVTALDVLEHVEHDGAAVREMGRVLRPGGIAVITVPAGMGLWSDWDVGLHHFRRYSRKGVRALFASSEWELLHVNYTNVVVYPAVWWVRRWRGSRGGKPGVAGSHGQAPRPEDRMPSPWLNRCLQAIFVGMARWRLPLPFGVSLLLVARKR